MWLAGWPLQVRLTASGELTLGKALKDLEDKMDESKKNTLSTMIKALIPVDSAKAKVSVILDTLAEEERKETFLKLQIVAVSEVESLGSSDRKDALSTAIQRVARIMGIDNLPNTKVRYFYLLLRLVLLACLGFVFVGRRRVRFRSVPLACLWRRSAAAHLHAFSTALAESITRPVSPPFLERTAPLSHSSGTATPQVTLGSELSLPFKKDFNLDWPNFYFKLNIGTLFLDKDSAIKSTQAFLHISWKQRLDDKVASLFSLLLFSSPLVALSSLLTPRPCAQMAQPLFVHLPPASFAATNANA